MARRRADQSSSKSEGTSRTSVPGGARSKEAKRGDASGTAKTASYKHPEATSLLRPDVGTQSQFRKKKAPAEYRYDSSISPALDWDAQSPVRDLGEWLIAKAQEASRLPPPHTFPAPQEFRNGRGEVVATVRSLTDALEQLKGIEKPFLNWAGKAERLSFEVPTLPLFVHERLSTKAILETLKGHRRAKQMMLDLFGDPQHSVADQILRAYEHADKWNNRLILGDSLVVMNSLLKYEGLGGQVQMIYMDPPYGVKFGSNFQPFVRKRDVKHHDDEDMTREPEMVKAYRDTWELGLHSYLTYLRDRLLLCRELLHPSGSVFVQIGDDNLHHVRELLDEIFGAENLAGLILFRKTGGLKRTLLASVGDYLLWYGRDIRRLKYRKLYLRKRPGEPGATQYRYVLDGEKLHELPPEDLPTADPRTLLTHDNLTSQGNPVYEYPFGGRSYKQNFKPPPSSMDRLAKAGRIIAIGNTLRYLRKLSDFPVFELNELWEDVGISGFSDPKLYVVQTTPLVVQRCMLMTTDPGDLVLDPTCGSGTTSYVAEQWGRRWISIDTSRVPLALARQRLLTATFLWYELKNESSGPAGGFEYKREGESRNPKHIGPGIVPHLQLENIANDEPPKDEVLVDRPEIDAKVTRVTGPLVVEGTIPTPVDWDSDGQTDTGAVARQDHASHVERMIEVLRRSPVLHVGGNKTVTLSNVRPPAKTLGLSAEAVMKAGNGSGDDQAVAIVFGPENGPISERLVYEAAREAHAKSYRHLYVIGFAIEPNARKLIENCEAVVGVPATYVQATPDLMMGDLLKNMRSSQIFSVCGLPEVRLCKADAGALKAMAADPKEKGWLQAELLGLDAFDPGTMEVHHRPAADVPCWMLDSDYNGLCFKASQVFFPRTAAWDDLKRTLRADYSESVWEHLAGTKSAPFQVGDHGQVAVKVIDDRGNELLVVKNAQEAQG